jgi:hypothetical protein
LSVAAARLADLEVRDVMAEEVWSHPQAVDNMTRESLRLLSEATGRHWWEASRLMKTSLGTEVLGRLVLAGLDPWQRSIGEWCAATYALCAKGLDEKGRLKLDFQLAVPPSGFEDAWDDDGGDDPAAVQAAIAGMFK